MSEAKQETQNGLLEALVPARRIEMQSEGISGQGYRHAVLRRHIHRWGSRRSDALHRHRLRSQRNLMVLRFLQDLRDQLLVGGVRIRSAHHRHLMQIVLERVITQFRRNDLKQAVDAGDDDQNSDNRFNSSHVPRSAQRDRKPTYPVRPSNSRKDSTTAVILTSRTSRVERRTSSTVPSVTLFPTVILKGIPTRSASLNFTPGRSLRSSRITSNPAASSC